MQHNYSFPFHFPTRLVFGAGSLAQLADARKVPLPGTAALIVTTSGGSVRRTGLLDRVVGMLSERGVRSVVFSRFSPNPLAEECDRAAQVMRDKGLDLVVGLGGGSAIDAAKAVALAAPNPGKLWDYIPLGTGGKKKPEHDPLPLIAIPTTAGTGTESDPWFVVSKEGEKIGFGTRKSFPYAAVVDPELMLTVPPAYTAWQGLDTLFHVTEAYVCRKHCVLSDLFALEAVRLVGRSLVRCYEDGSDLEARTEMAWASTLGGLTEWINGGGCISEHSLEHAMGALHPHLTHGKGLSMICLAYFEKLLEKGADPDRYAELARALTGNPQAAAGEFLPALQALLEKLGAYPLSWKEEGFAREELSRIAKLSRSVGAGMFRGDPVELTDADLEEILEKSFRE